LVVTNGYRVWQRSIPIGGNHFTRALTKELRLTFAKAEHLKRNASSAQDPKAVFQAMRPVFSDLLTEIQRSINYFTSIDRAAKIGKILALGNAMKLPGLQRYLGQNLGYEVVRLDSFRGVTGPEVVGAPAFKENLLSFGPCYGLALQGLGKSALRTNLLPREIVKDRLIRQKKPWAVAAAAVLLLGCTISYASFSRAMGTMGTKEDGPFKSSEALAEEAVKTSQDLKTEADGHEDQFRGTDDIGKHLVENIEGRLRWLELLKAVNSCLPSDTEGQRPEEIALRNELHITSLQCYRMEELENWFAINQKWYDALERQSPGSPPAAATPANGTALDVASAAEAAGTVEGGGPTGSGWVVRLTGHHYHNHNRPREIAPEGAEYLQGAQFVEKNLIENLKSRKLILPEGGEQGKEEAVSVTDLGIGYPVLVDPGQIYPHQLVNPNVESASPMAGGAMGYAMGEEPGLTPGFGPGYMGGPGRLRPTASAAEEEEEEEDPVIEVLRFDFVVEFCWQPE
jgi:type IV pilus assembly protein PilM